VVPTSGRDELLADCLETLVAQDYPSRLFEVVVVANGPETHTAPRAAPPVVRVEHLGTADANAARNHGIQVAHGELVCLVDDDVLAPRGWLRALVAGAVRSGAACVGGGVRPRFEHSRPRYCERHVASMLTLEASDRDVETREVWGCNMAVRREAIATAGPFRERMALSQEWEWQQRLLVAGGRIVLVPDAWVWHRRLESDLGFARQVRENFRRGLLIGSTDRSLSPGRTAAKAAKAALHGLTSGCSCGLVEASRRLGVLCGRAASPRSLGMRDGGG